MDKITIAIDGYSSTGKSTVAKQLADSLGYIYVDSGAMYRAITLYALETGIISDNHFDKDALIAALPYIELHFEKNPEWTKAHIFMNGRDVEADIRNLRVSDFVSPIATIHEVRTKLVAQQKVMGRLKGVVMDGRDIGTVVFPDAELKIFMNASAGERAKRRYKELSDRGENIKFEHVLKNLEDRDHIDSTREDSPLKKAADAVEVNNSDMDLEQQFLLLLQLAKERIAASS